VENAKRRSLSEKETITIIPSSHTENFKKSPLVKVASSRSKTIYINNIFYI
jgi:hypothetical protein